ncbi:DNA-binding XRE family transcriptional regulator [Aquimarina sp. MAR_2010_214]|uniref:helix-turn-helix domain-containing protein n=1 Tax=Aquimarina sp. MAR_2010_214 TaxID=1250026 RepID=UPI000C708480|nr:helix-turn-helix transcriptional regulator [Aquimarina sp. MAR_2010_214]PKV50838.1 DNA-binding XRE family transcriptional regulator [Aquimarina sp. MAR_2010_214]
MSIGSRIKLIRKQADMTQAQFAEAIGMKQSPLSQIESDKILPSIETLKIVRRKFNISYDFIIDGKEIPSGVSALPNHENRSFGIDSRNLVSQLVQLINTHREENDDTNLQIDSILELENFVQTIIDTRIGRLEDIMEKLLSKVDEKMFEEGLKQEIQESDQRLQDKTLLRDSDKSVKKA